VPTKRRKQDIYSRIRAELGRDATCAFASEDAAAGNIRSWLRTGLYPLDLALSCGRGLPFGNFVEILGDEGQGKTSLLCCIMAALQRVGGKAILIDREHSLDRERAGDLGVRTKELLVVSPDHLEAFVDDVFPAIRQATEDSDEPLGIFVDSLAQCPTKKELETGLAGPGEHARLYSHLFRKETKFLSVRNALMVATNQIKHRIGVVYGTPETTFGGRAPRFSAIIRLRVRGKPIYDGRSTSQPPTGLLCVVQAVKNKAWRPHRKAWLPLYFDERGFGSIDALWETLFALKLIRHKASDTYSFVRDSAVSVRKRDFEKRVRGDARFHAYVRMVLREAYESA
jgi:protein RecA